MATFVSRVVPAALQKLRRLAWSNKYTLAAATAGLDGVYAVKKRLNPGQRSSAIAGSAEASDTAIFEAYRQRYPLDRTWFWEGASVTWDILLSHQRAAGVKGALMEIGVLKGRSAAHLALHAGADEAIILVDPAMRAEALDAVRAAHPDNNVVLPMLSIAVHRRPELLPFAAACRWIHIDGEHSGPAVLNDLDVAKVLLQPRGVICLDDFFTPAYPQITAAALYWLKDNVEFTMFMTGYQKAYICRRDDALFYLEFIHRQFLDEAARRQFGEITLWKTAAVADMNCFGVTPRFGSYAMKGPDNAPDQILLG